MELREYMSVRRAYNLVRQQTEAARRLTFEEFAILCRLDAVSEPVKTSEIADYQGALRPTMTHRTNRLADLGFIERGEGQTDRRNIVCRITEDGKAHAERLAVMARESIPTGQPLARVSPSRLKSYVDVMGTVFCTAGDLLLVSIIANGEEPCTITTLVERVGLLQPTVSMSVSSLVERGLARRTNPGTYQTRSLLVELTDAGRERGMGLAERIVTLKPRRRARTK